MASQLPTTATHLDPQISDPGSNTEAQELAAALQPQASQILRNVFNIPSSKPISQAILDLEQEDEERRQNLDDHHDHPLDNSELQNRDGDGEQGLLLEELERELKLCDDRIDVLLDRKVAVREAIESRHGLPSLSDSHSDSDRSFWEKCELIEGKFGVLEEVPGDKDVRAVEVLYDISRCMITIRALDKELHGRVLEAGEGSREFDDLDLEELRVVREVMERLHDEAAVEDAAGEGTALVEERGEGIQEAVLRVVQELEGFLGDQSVGGEERVCFEGAHRQLNRLLAGSEKRIE